MSEQANGTAAASTPAQSAGQALPSAQSGQSSELETLRSQYSATVAERDRFKQQAEGNREYYEVGNKYGLKDKKAFERLGPLLEAERSGKIRLDQLAAALAEQEQEGQDQPDMNSMLEKFAKEKGFVSKAELDKMERIRTARSQHADMTKAEREALKELMANVLPENADDWDKQVYEGFLSHQLDQSRSVYPKGHPLHFEDYDGPEIAAPYERAALEKRLTEIVANRDKVRGAQAAAKGDEHNKRKGHAPTVAGAAASTPKRGQEADDDSDAAAEARKSRVVAKIEAKRAARAGSAT